MTKEYGSESIAQQAFLDLVRVKQFDKIGMTHLCCHRKRSLSSSSKLMVEEEIDEILDEERYLIEELEDFMRTFAERLDSPIEENWIKLLPGYFVPWKEQDEELRFWRTSNDLTLRIGLEPHPPPWYPNTVWRPQELVAMAALMNLVRHFGKCGHRRKCFKSPTVSFMPSGWITITKTAEVTIALELSMRSGTKQGNTGPHGRLKC
jgi:hypothetical protein